MPRSVFWRCLQLYAIVVKEVFFLALKGKYINMRIEFQDSEFLSSCHDGSERETKIAIALISSLR